MDPWTLFSVKIVGEDKCDREGNKHQAGGVEAGNKDKKGNSPKEHIEHHLVGILHGGFHGLKTLNYVDAGDAYQEKHIRIEDIYAEVVALEATLKGDILSYQGDKACTVLSYSPEPGKEKEGQQQIGNHRVEQLPPGDLSQGPEAYPDQRNKPD